MQKTSISFSRPFTLAIICFDCCVVTTGLVGWFNGYLYADLLASMSLISLVYVSIVWWRDVLRNPFTGHHTRAVQTGIRYGMILFIVSEMMLFSFFLGFRHSSLALQLN
jgi:hypothetical protein